MEDNIDKGINKNCKITNDSSFDLLVLDAFNKDDNSIEIMYEQTLKPLKTNDGEKTITTGKEGTVKLNDYYKDPKTHKKEYSFIYDLILADSKSLFPIKDQGEMFSFDKNGYPAIKATKTDSQQMQLAYKFQQYIGAYPTSNLIKDFHSAIQKATKEKDLDKAMKKFFDKTKEFKKLNMVAYTAVMTYMERYSVIWANNKKSYIYYFYGVPATSQNITSHKPSYIGKLTLTKASTAGTDPNDNSGGYKLTFTDANNQDTKLYYNRGQFVDDLTTDEPNIAVQGSFIQKSSLTHKSKDKTIIPILAGTIDGNQVLGTSVKQDGKGSHKPWYAFMFTKTFQVWFMIIMAGMMLVSVLGAVVKGFQWLNRAINQKTIAARKKAGNDKAEASDKDRQECRNDLDKKVEPKYEQELKENFKKLGFSEEIPSQAGFNAAAKEQSLEKQIQLTEDNAEIQENVLKKGEKLAGELAPYADDPELQEAVSKQYDARSSLKKARESLDKARKTRDPDTIKKASSDVSAANKSLVDANKDIETFAKNTQEDISDKVKAQIAEGDKAAKEAKEADDEINENTNEEADGDIDPKAAAEDFPIE